MLLEGLVWWALLAVMGAALAPVAERLFSPNFADRGRAFAKPLALVALTFLSWLLTSAGVPHRVSLAISVAALAGAASAAWRGKKGVGSRLPDRLLDEGLFLAAFVFFAAIRALEPEVFGAEKYMDFAFFNTLTRAERFPPPDPWMSGVTINYYYFGYLLFANLARATGIAAAVAYNLSLATIGAVVVTCAVSIGRTLSGRLEGGLLAAALVALAGNLDGARQLLVERTPLGSFDYWRPTRLVPHTINEFPFFSLLHGDLHPHVSALVINVTLIGVAVATSLAYRGSPTWRAHLPRIGVLAVLLAALALSNPWDLPVYYTLIGVLALHRLWDDEHPLRAVFSAAALVGVLAAAMLLLSLPFTLHFHAQYQGIGRVHALTALGPFLLIFGFLLLPAVGRLGRELVVELNRDPPLRDLVVASLVFTMFTLYVATRSPVFLLAAGIVVTSLLTLLGPRRGETASVAIALVAAAATALAACEVVYLRDSYGADLHRMNTVFKLYFQAWILLALAFPACFFSLLEGSGRGFRVIATTLLLAGLTLSLCYPMGAIAVRWQQDPGRASLDGVGYLERDHPADAAAIRWLATEVRGLPVVVEATGDAYSYFARVSSNTGLPTLLGWANHESVWRGADPRIQRRKLDLDLLYGDTPIERVRELVDRYRVGFVFVGELEREKYPPGGLDKFTRHPELFERVYRSGPTEVFAVRETIASE